MAHPTSSLEESLSSSILIIHDDYLELSDEAVASNFWLANSPRGNPYLWNWINGTCCLVSVWLFLELTYDFVEMDVMLEYGLPYYAVYNFTTTVVWCVEDGLCLYYEWMQPPLLNYHQRNIVIFVHTILLVAALYFLVTSVIFFGQCLFVTTNFVVTAPIQMEQIKMDVFTSIIIYILALIYVCLWERPAQGLHQQHHRQRHQRDNDESVLQNSCLPVCKQGSKIT